MIDSKIDLFKTIYNVVDYLYKTTKNEELGKYISDADPYFWDDEGSFDPVVYNDFANNMNLDFDYSGYGYKTMKQYFTKLDDYYVGVKRAALKLSESEYIDIINKVNK